MSICGFVARMSDNLTELTDTYVDIKTNSAPLKIKLFTIKMRISKYRLCYHDPFT